MGLIQKFKEKAVRVAPAVMGVGLIAGVGMALATGGALAANENVTAIAKYYGLSTMQWIMAIMALIFGGATIFLKDYRTAILALVCVVGAIIVGFLGL